MIPALTRPRSQLAASNIVGGANYFCSVAGFCGRFDSSIPASPTLGAPWRWPDRSLADSHEPQSLA
jgi:hypothetical protein